MPFLRMTPAPGDEHSGLPSSSYQFATHMSLDARRHLARFAPLLFQEPHPRPRTVRKSSDGPRDAAQHQREPDPRGTGHREQVHLATEREGELTRLATLVEIEVSVLTLAGCAAEVGAIQPFQDRHGRWRRGREP